MSLFSVVVARPPVEALFSKVLADVIGQYPSLRYEQEKWAQVLTGLQYDPCTQAFERILQNPFLRIELIGPVLELTTGDGLQFRLQFRSAGELEFEVAFQKGNHSRLAVDMAIELFRHRVTGSATLLQQLLSFVRDEEPVRRALAGMAGSNGVRHGE